MTLEQYQQQCEHLPAGSVKLNPSEYYHIEGTKCVFVPTFHCTYHIGGVIPTDQTLYTIDDQGNPRAPSVFSI